MKIWDRERSWPSRFHRVAWMSKGHAVSQLVKMSFRPVRRIHTFSVASLLEMSFGIFFLWNFPYPKYNSNELVQMSCMFMVFHFFLNCLVCYCSIFHVFQILHSCIILFPVIQSTFITIYIYTGCNRRNGPDFGRVFLRSYYTDITQNTYIPSSMVTEILAREVWNFDSYYSLIDYQIHIETGRKMWFL